MTQHAASATTTFLDRVRDRLVAEPERSTFRFVVDDPLSSVGFVLDGLPNGEFDARARALAVRLRERARVGDRALLLCEPGPGYITAFFACLYAGIVAVPSYPPGGTTAQRLERVALVARDCRAALIVVDEAMDVDVSFEAGLAGLPLVRVGELALADAASWRRPPIIAADTAFLQYSSGSTGQPKGVMVTHANLLAQTGVLAHRFLAGPEEPSSTLTWLPPYHDMGLIGCLLTPSVYRCSVTVMSPLAFLKRPLRWLQVASEIGAQVTGAPNFAFDLCVRKATPEVVDALDLSNLEVLFSGAEPVRAATLQRFADTFGPAGFRRGAYLPCYGLAEATLAVTATLRSEAARVLSVSSAGVHEGVARPAATPEDEREVVSCGPVLDGHAVRITGPAGAALGQGQVGEIWVAGPSVTAGYFRRPDLTRATYVHTDDDPDSVWLRTGDLGFLDGDELVVVGRSKDLLIVNGRNHHPHDLEDTVATVHPAIRLGGIAALAWEEGDTVALLIEVDGRTAEAAAAWINDAVRAALAANHGIAPGPVVLAKPGTVLKTSSGKVQRTATGAALASGRLDDHILWSFEELANSMAFVGGGPR